MKVKCFAVILLIIGMLTAGKAALADSTKPYFEDLKGSFAEEQVKQLSALGIVEGLTPDEFRPNAPITRQQFALWLAKTLGISPIFPQNSTFADISPGLLQSGYIESLAKLNIITGSTESNFMPDQPITRQDAAVLAYNAVGKNQGQFSAADFQDRDLVSSYAYQSVAFASSKGWMNGNNQYFHPLRQMTRAEAAVLLAQLLKTRNSQALTTIPNISSREKSIKVGETDKLEFETSKASLAFTAVYGTDSPGICNIDASGMLTGVETGNSTLTVNSGYNSFVVNTKVTSSRQNAFDTEVKNINPETNFNYLITQQAPDSSFKQTEQKNNPGPLDGLTSESDTWSGFLRQQGRDILVDLHKISSINGISLEFLQNPSWGVWFPEYLKAELSSDGIAWQHLGYVYPGLNPANNDAHNVQLTLAFSPVNTRYIKLSFPVDIWVFARHLSIKSSSPPETPAILAPIKLSNNSTAVNSNREDNYQDILLVYSGDNSSNQTFNTNDFTPLISYQERSGKIKDRMFDTLLFLPYYGMPTDKNTWFSYIEDLFAPVQQLHALDQAVAWVNTYSDLDIREKVILTIPYPDVATEDFGALENNEQPNFSEASVGVKQATQNRFAAVKWYYDSVIEQWNRAGFKNIDLVGIYWYGETIEKNSGEKELVLETARLVRNDNLDFYWIPYYGVKGYEKWHSYGFTQVFLQPNYFSQNKPPQERMDAAAKAAEKYNLGIEVELDEAVFTNDDFYNIFYNQLKRGKQLGLDSLNNAYYAGHVKRTLLRASRGIDPKIRAIYDDLYLWVSGKYE